MDYCNSSKYQQKAKLFKRIQGEWGNIASFDFSEGASNLIVLLQVEEERDEIQRQLSQEKSARALQEGILNNHLWRQKELEEETRRTIGKSSDVRRFFFSN